MKSTQEKGGMAVPGPQGATAAPAGPGGPAQRAGLLRKERTAWAVLEMLWPSPWKRDGYSPSSQLFVLIVVSGEEVIAK